MEIAGSPIDVLLEVQAYWKRTDKLSWAKRTLLPRFLENNSNSLRAGDVILVEIT